MHVIQTTTTKNARDINTHYYTKNFKTQTIDHRQDQEPTTVITKKMNNNREHPCDPCHMPTKTPLQTTEDSQPPNDTLMMNYQKKKTPARKKDVGNQLLTAPLQLNKKERKL